MNQFKRSVDLNVEYRATGSPNLYRLVRAAFIAQGTTFNSWCIARGVNRQTAEKALKGERRGSSRPAALLEEVLLEAFPERRNG